MIRMNRDRTIVDVPDGPVSRRSVLALSTDAGGDVVELGRAAAPDATPLTGAEQHAAVGEAAAAAGFGDDTGLVAPAGHPYDASPTLRRIAERQDYQDGVAERQKVRDRKDRAARREDAYSSAEFVARHAGVDVDAARADRAYAVSQRSAALDRRDSAASELRKAQAQVDGYQGVVTRAESELHLVDVIARKPGFLAEVDLHDPYQRAVALEVAQYADVDGEVDVTTLPASTRSALAGLGRRR